MIFTGSSDVHGMRRHPKTVGFFRRFHRILEIPPLSPEFARECFLRLAKDVGADAEACWPEFEAAWFSRNGKSAVDAIKKYLDLHICRAHQRRWITVKPGGRCVLADEFQHEFFSCVCDHREVDTFMQEYAGGSFSDSAVAALRQDVPAGCSCQ